MVFETIYSLYEKEVVNEIKKLKTDEEIKFMLKKQSLDIVFWNCKSERIDLYRRREKIALAGL